MMKFDVLSASAMLDADRWDRLVDALPPERRDIHFTSAYGRVQEKHGGEAVLAVLQDDNHFIMQPFIKRETPTPGYFDLCSPYGYGGPVSNIAHGATVWGGDMMSSMFSAQIELWASREKIVSEFCYLHPLMMSDHRRWLGQTVLQHVKDVIVIKLETLSEDTVARRVRRGIKRARDAQCTVTQLRDLPSTRERFHYLYEQSMERKCAAERWRFSRDYIDAHFSELGARVFAAWGEDGGERLLMTIGGYGTAYAHLLASNGRALHTGLDEFLYYSAALALRDDGYERFHLGGGLTSDPHDSLLMFKAGLGTRIPLASYRVVFNDLVYDEMSEALRDDEIKRHGRESTARFFPTYRREFA